jgi:hypothetical protein
VGYSWLSLSKHRVFLYQQSDLYSPHEDGCHKVIWARHEKNNPYVYGLSVVWNTKCIKEGFSGDTPVPKLVSWWGDTSDFSLYDPFCSLHYRTHPELAVYLRQYGPSYEAQMKEDSLAGMRKPYGFVTN